MTCRHLLSFLSSFIHTHKHRHPSLISHTTHSASHTSHTPVLRYFSVYSRPASCGVCVALCMFCLWSVTCTSTVGPNWMWALSELIRAIWECVCVCVLASWLVGRHPYRWGLQMWWASWSGLVLSSWFSIMGSPAAIIPTTPTNLLSPLSLSLSHTHILTSMWHTWYVLPIGQGFHSQLHSDKTSRFFKARV